ncbi:MAG: pirin family protein [Desulfovibrionaceae bacterium]|nr:pirin family protein [Desulfovibrionaceae bacterium]
MIDVIPAADCHAEQFDSIRVRSLLSYNNYFDPHNSAFGPLLVFNDYRVPPAAGFRMHPHPNCEQIFVVLSGVQKCSDNLNNSLVLEPVTVQRVTAGEGYARATSNYGNSTLHFLSLRFQPRRVPRLTEHRLLRVQPHTLKDRLFHAVCGDEKAAGSAEPLWFDTNADIYLAVLDQTSRQHFVPAGCRSLVYVADGGALMDGRPLESGDHVRITGPETVFLAPSPWALLIFTIMR